MAQLSYTEDTETWLGINKARLLINMHVTLDPWRAGARGDRVFESRVKSTVQSPGVVSNFFESLNSALANFLHNER